MVSLALIMDREEMLAMGVLAYITRVLHWLELLSLSKLMIKLCTMLLQAPPTLILDLLVVMGCQTSKVPIRRSRKQ